MNLLVRINLVLALAFVLAALAVGWACAAMLQEDAKQETLRDSTPARRQFLDACHALGRQSP